MIVHEERSLDSLRADIVAIHRELDARWLKRLKKWILRILRRGGK